MSSRWEYRIVHFQADKWTATGLPKDLGQKFDNYGAAGWELVSIESIQRPRLFWGASSTVATRAMGS